MSPQLTWVDEIGSLSIGGDTSSPGGVELDVVAAHLDLHNLDRCLVFERNGPCIASPLKVRGHPLM